MIKECIIYPDGHRKTEKFAGYHQVGSYFFDVSDMKNIICWQIVKVLKGNKIKVIRHPKEKLIIEQEFHFLNEMEIE